MRLRAVVSSGAVGSADVDQAAHRLTLFPYFSHYSDPRRARSTSSAMAVSGLWPPQVLGSANVLSPDRLRFCQSCRMDMLDQHADAWWIRAHQLPSVLVCPEHAEPLRESSVDRATRRKSYVLATERACPADAPAVVEGADYREIDDLAHLARESAALLHARCDVHPDDRREDYLRRLKRLNMLNHAGEANLGKVARAMDARYGSTLEFWPELVSKGRCAQGWLGRLFMGERGSHPLHHLLLKGWLACYPD